MPLIYSLSNYLVKIFMFGCFMWKRNVLVIYIFVVAENYVDFCPRTIVKYVGIMAKIRPSVGCGIRLSVFNEMAQQYDWLLLSIKRNFVEGIMREGIICRLRLEYSMLSIKNDR